MKFRKRAAIMDAVQWKDGKVSETRDWLNDAVESLKVVRLGNNVHIETLDGIMVASDGDWIVRGVDGEIYSCKPDTFEKAYKATD